MADSSRAERLKAALRENLKRRKAQARGRARADGSSAPSEPHEAEPKATLADSQPAKDDDTRP